MSLRIGFLRIGHDRCGGCRRVCRCGRNCDCMVTDESLTRPLVCHDCLVQREGVVMFDRAIGFAS